MNCLIIGGTSGLGLAFAKRLASSHDVHITGRRDPHTSDLIFHQLDLSQHHTLSRSISDLVAELPEIDLLVHASGFYQEGTVTDLDETQIGEMMDVCLNSAILFTRQLLLKQGDLSTFVAVTSTSQYTPRLLEPIYTAAKAGLGAYANSLSLDPRVKKTLVVGPAGMKTAFHDGRDVEMSTYLKPEWVVSQVEELLEGSYSYKYARILRDPAHVEVKETR